MSAPAQPAIPPARAVGRPYRVCFVCTGNICRSPMAEVVLRELAEARRSGRADAGAARPACGLEISSAGTGPWHVGQGMDPRAREALARAGRADPGHVARQISARELADPDLVLALDLRHRTALTEMDGGRVLDGRLFLLGSFDPERAGAGLEDAPEIADPYYGGDSDFEQCLREVEAACRGLHRALVLVHGHGG